MARTDKKIKAGERVKFICPMNRELSGKIVKKDKKFLIETKDRFYYLDKVTLI